MARKNGTTESFIEKAKAVHGGRYDYSLVEYECSRATVKVLCPDHGVFEQRASHHLEGQGCPVCGNSRKTTKGSFVKKARKIHGDRYGYDAVVYSGAHTKVEILCHKPHHGLFSQRPGDHLQGRGCPKCAGDSRRSTKDAFVDKCNAVHGSRYGYSLTEYRDSGTKIKILCHEHGLFEQTPQNHLAGKGCPKCSGNIRLSIEEFVEKAKLVHGGSYGYSSVDYKNNHTKVKILCYKHGVFEQRPSDHFNGNGCPSCTATGYDPEKTGSVYLLVTPDSIKVGITNRPVQERIANINSTTECKFNIERVWSFADGSVAPKVERVVLAMLRAKYKNPAKKFDGYTETFVTTDVSFVASTIDAVVSSINK